MRDESAVLLAQGTTNSFRFIVGKTFTGLRCVEKIEGTYRTLAQVNQGRTHVHAAGERLGFVRRKHETDDANATCQRETRVFVHRAANVLATIARNVEETGVYIGSAHLSVPQLFGRLVLLRGRRRFPDAHKTVVDVFQADNGKQILRGFRATARRAEIGVARVAIEHVDIFVAAFQNDDDIHQMNAVGQNPVYSDCDQDQQQQKQNGEIDVRRSAARSAAVKTTAKTAAVSAAAVSAATATSPRGKKEKT